MEIYLSHMMIFRIVEKLGLANCLNNDVLQYIITVVTVICGATVFSVIMQKIIRKTTEIISIRTKGL